MSDRDDRQTDAEESEEEEEDIPATQADEDFAWLELRQVGGGGRFSFADASTCKIGSSRSNRAMDLQLDVGSFSSEVNPRTFCENTCSLRAAFFSFKKWPLNKEGAFFTMYSNVGIYTKI